MTRGGGDRHRQILVLTGTRAEYGLLQSPMEAIEAHEELSLSVVATGMHLSPRHGNTIDDIRADGFAVDREVLMQLDGDSGKAMAKSVGTGINGLTDAIDSLDPDIVLLLGDRGEPLAGAISAAHMGIPVAHIHGGEAMTGATIDDSNRHAITRFAHLHFPASESSAERLRKFGEEPWRITTVGAPGLDTIRDGRYEDPDTIRGRYGFDAHEPLLLVVQHPVTTQPDQAGDQFRTTLEALESVDAQTVIIYPNSDAGSEAIIEELETRSFGDDVLRFRNLPRNEYLGVMAAADAMVGNSSSGIIEGPAFGLPVVDIGPRQDGRERGENTLSVPHEKPAIDDAIRRCLEDETVQERAATTDNPYDYGGAGPLIAETLADVSIDDELLRKRLTY